ncbi:MAG: PEP-utilizing enzyme [Candidatus Micrarchaeota archaeon]|nr:PEP-utilizing enzyme [Candidatus Micrarchaeota archaeon]
MTIWHKLITRRIGVQIAIAWNNALQLQKKVYEVTCRDNLTYWDGNKSDYYLDKQEWEKYHAGLYKLLDSEEVITTLPWKAKEFLENTLREVQNTLSIDLKNLSNEQLAKINAKIADKNDQYYTRMWIIFFTGEPMAETVRSELLKKLGDKRKTDELLLSFSSPLELNDAMKERLELLEIARNKNKLSEVELEEKLIEHTEKFKHIPMFDFNHEPFTIKHFLNELEKIKNPEEELAEIKQSLIDRKEKFNEQLKALNLAQESRMYKLIQMLKFSVFLRDYRDGLRQKLNLELKKLYEEIGKRADLTSSDLSLFTNKEIIDFLNGKLSVQHMQEESAQRHQSFLLIQRGQKIEIYSGHKAKEIAAKELALNKETKLGEVKGITGAKGKATGKAVIVHTNLDLNKVQDGCVLVAHMTRQDYVPAMRKCIAFVTDEGGITCHTAIIARELGVPCIVGTGNATEVFKDGDLIEVNTDKGTAKKVEKK